MTCFHGVSDPRDCGICMQLELDDVGEPGVARSAEEIIWGPIVLDKDKADRIREVMGQT